MNIFSLVYVFLGTYALISLGNRPVGLYVQLWVDTDQQFCGGTRCQH